jgi:hypothetical protein
MPRKYTITYHETAEPTREPVTKFGGQPVWIAEPQWPLSKMYGTPMQFICQIAVPAEIVSDGAFRMAYLFMTADEEHGFLAYTFEPAGGENALIIQPGDFWEGPSLPLREGPTLYRRAWRNRKWEHTPCEIAVELMPGEDPSAGTWDVVESDDKPAFNAYFDALIEDKLGGSPVPTVNNASELAQWREGWRLLLQLTDSDSDGYDPDAPFFNQPWDRWHRLRLHLGGRPRGQVHEIVMLIGSRSVGLAWQM